MVKVKEAVGHADLRTTMGYTHLVREHLRSLVVPEKKVRVSEESASPSRLFSLSEWIPSPHCLA